MKIVYICLIITGFAVQYSKQDKCHWIELELCAATAVVTIQGTLPQTPEEAKTFCTYITDTFNCVHNYSNNCLSNKFKELLEFILEETEQNMYEACTPGSELEKEFLQYTPCLSRFWDNRMTFLNDFLAATDILPEVKNDKKLTIGCCAYRRFYNDIHEDIRSKCGEESLKYFNRFLNLYISDLPNIICNNFDDKDSKCLEALPPAGTVPKGTNSNSIVSRLIYTFLGNS